MFFSRKVLAALICFDLFVWSPLVYGQDAVPVTKVAPATKTAGSVVTPAEKQDIQKAVAASVKPATADAVTPSVFVAPTEPTTMQEATDAVKQGLAFVTARNWLGLAAVLIFIIMFALRSIKFGGQNIFEKFGKRWAYIIVPLLSIAAMVLANLAGGVSWSAVWIVLASGPAGAMLNDLVKRGILGQEVTTPMVASAATAKTAAGSVTNNGK